jgi:hypothetical protein
MHCSGPAAPDSIAARAQQALRGQLAVGSLLPEQNAHEEQRVLLLQQQLNNAMAAAAEMEHDELQRLREHFIEMFPHGAPVSGLQGVILYSFLLQLVSCQD